MTFVCVCWIKDYQKKYGEKNGIQIVIRRNKRGLSGIQRCSCTKNHVIIFHAGRIEDICCFVFCNHDLFSGQITSVHLFTDYPDFDYGLCFFWKKITPQQISGQNL